MRGRSFFQQLTDFHLPGRARVSNPEGSTSRRGSGGKGRRRALAPTLPSASEGRAAQPRTIPLSPPTYILRQFYQAYIEGIERAIAISCAIRTNILWIAQIELWGRWWRKCCEERRPESEPVSVLAQQVVVGYDLPGRLATDQKFIDWLQARRRQ